MIFSFSLEGFFLFAMIMLNLSDMNDDVKEISLWVLCCLFRSRSFYLDKTFDEKCEIYIRYFFFPRFVSLSSDR